MGLSCFKASKREESVFNVLRKITNTMRDLEIKENRLTEDKMPMKRAKIHALKQQHRLPQARQAFVTYKKYQETRDQYWSLRENLERIKHEIDKAHTNSMAAAGLRQADNVMQELLTNTELADVDAILDKCRDHMEQADEVFQALAAPLDGEYDDELDEEMERLMQEGDSLPQEEEVVELPSPQASSTVRKKVRKQDRRSAEALRVPLLDKEGLK